MRAVRVRSRHFNGRQPSGVGKYINISTAGCVFFGGLMRGLKIPQYEFALKMQGGLMREGGGGGGGAYLRDTTVYRASGSCNSAQQLQASSITFYLHKYICTLSKPQTF